MQRLRAAAIKHTTTTTTTTTTRLLLLLLLLLLQRTLHWSLVVSARQPTNCRTVVSTVI